MRNILLGTVGATALAYAVAWGGAAVAGGYSAGAMPGPSSAPFEGFTIGLGVGYSQNDSEARPTGLIAGIPAGGDYDEAGARFAAELRYMHAVSESFYIGVGLEAYYDASEPSAACNGSIPVGITCSSSDAFGGDLVAYLGADIGGALLYGKGGATLANYEDKATIAIGPGIDLSEDGWNEGYVAGLGVETHITDSMTLALEGDYRWMADRDFELLGLTGPLVTFEQERWNVGVKLRSGF